MRGYIDERKMYNGRPILLLGCCSSWWNSLDYIYFSAILVPSLHFPWRGLSWVELSKTRQDRQTSYQTHIISLSLLKYPSVIHVHGWWTPMRSLEKRLKMDERQKIRRKQKDLIIDTIRGFTQNCSSFPIMMRSLVAFLMPCFFASCIISASFHQ